MSAPRRWSKCAWLTNTKSASSMSAALSPTGSAAGTRVDERVEPERQPRDADAERRAPEPLDREVIRSRHGLSLVESSDARNTNRSSGDASIEVPRATTMITEYAVPVTRPAVSVTPARTISSDPRTLRIAPGARRLQARPAGDPSRYGDPDDLCREPRRRPRPPSTAARHREVHDVHADPGHDEEHRAEGTSTIGRKRSRHLGAVVAPGAEGEARDEHAEHRLDAEAVRHRGQRGHERQGHHRAGSDGTRSPYRRPTRTATNPTARIAKPSTARPNASPTLAAPPAPATTSPRSTQPTTSLLMATDIATCANPRRDRPRSPSTAAITGGDEMPNAIATSNAEPARDVSAPMNLRGGPTRARNPLRAGAGGSRG